MIAFIEPLPVGNALRVLLAPPAGATQWRLLRKAADDFAGETDPNAAVIYDGDERKSILDIASLTNGTPYYYREYAFVGAAWQASATVSGTPAAAGQGIGPDALSLVRDRVELALRAAVAAGALTHEYGYIPCLTAPPLFEDTRWPVVTVHLQSDSAEVRGIGEILDTDQFDATDGVWRGGEGWLSRVRLQIVSWCLNPDQRIALRQALKLAIIGNLPVFDAAGMDQVDPQFSDVEDFESYAAPVYQTFCNFSCLAPAVLTGDTDAIEDVTVMASAYATAIEERI